MTQQSHCHYSKQSDSFEIAIRTDYEQYVNNVHEDGTSHVSGFFVIRSITAARIARSIRSSIAQIVVSSII
jgi:hypothetical protein